MNSPLPPARAGQEGAAAPEETDAEFFCRIDRFDRIQEMGGESLSGPEAAPLGQADALLGSSLYTHVSGHFTRRFLRRFIADARATGQQPRRLYRCDSPQTRRLMEMRAVPEGDGAVRLEHRLVEESPFDFAIELHAAAKRGLAYYLRCSNCCKLRPIRQGEWREPEDYAQPDHSHQVVHTICPACQSGQVVRRLVLRPAG